MAPVPDIEMVQVVNLSQNHFHDIRLRMILRLSLVQPFALCEAQPRI